MSGKVRVTNISKATTEKEVYDFFGFCGKISSLKLDNAASATTKSADVVFEKKSAAKTAVLLDNTQLGTNQVQVTSEDDQESAHSEEQTTSDPSSTGDEHFEQEDKPRSRILAEYLASGYVISDKTIEKALAYDKQYGISARFTNALTSFDQKTQATARAQSIDKQTGASTTISQVTNAATTKLGEMADYFLHTDAGQKLRSLYDQGSKEVMDVHNEARRLADGKEGNKKEVVLEHIPGTDKTHCTCAGDEGICKCSADSCTCASCPKAKPENVAKA